MQVKKNTLLLLACLVWTAAGVNILRIGLLAYATQVSLPHILLSLLVFFLFQVFVFGRLENTPDGSWDIGRTDSSSSAFLTRSPFSSWLG